MSTTVARNGAASILLTCYYRHLAPTNVPYPNPVNSDAQSARFAPLFVTVYLGYAVRVLSDWSRTAAWSALAAVIVVWPSAAGPPSSPWPSPRPGPPTERVARWTISHASTAGEFRENAA
jgi:hypothetical protein